MSGLLSPYSTNLNQRLVKTPKIYFEDLGLAVRLQGWSEFKPILLSPYFGHLLENLALAEITRFFTNRGEQPQVYFVRSKEQVEIDFLVQLSNQRFLAIELKFNPSDFNSHQIRILKSLELHIVEQWTISNSRSHDFDHARVVCLDQIFEELEKLH